MHGVWVMDFETVAEARKLYREARVRYATLHGPGNGNCDERLRFDIP